MLTELKKLLEAEKKEKQIFDIVLYGSAVKGKALPEDIDIIVIFRYGSLKERLEKIQKIKKRIKLEKKIDIKGILWEELFKPEFFARKGVFLEGISLFDGEPFSKKIDFAGFSLFRYDLKNKTHTEKVKFNYILSGRKSKGIIKMLEGNHLAAGIVMIPIKNSLEFEDLLKKHSINYFKNDVLIYEGRIKS